MIRPNSLSRLARVVVFSSFSKQQQRLSHRGYLCRTFASLPEMLSNDATAATPTTDANANAAAAAAAPSPSYLHRTVFRRPLNPPAIAFSSPEGRALFSQALADGTAEGFFPLIEQFSTQDEPAWCGLASLSMVLNALCLDPRRPWKGPWRFYSEKLLDCCIPLERVKEEGVSLPQVACLARCNGAVARVVRPPPLAREKEERASDIALESEIREIEEEDEGGGGEKTTTTTTKSAVADAERAFRDAVLASCRGGPEAIVASYSRRLVSQTGDGHFSPIGAYNAEKDAVLVLDVARFKYSPHWLPLRSLVRAMRPRDKATGLPRGWLGVRAAAAPRSVLFTLEPTASLSSLSRAEEASEAAAAADAAAAARLFVDEALPELLISSSSSSSAEGEDDDSSGVALVAKAAAAAPLAAVAAFVGLRAPSAAAARATVAAAAAEQQHRLDGGGRACGADMGGEEAGGGEPSSPECAIPDAAAALLAELERWPAVDAVRSALDAAHPYAGSPMSPFSVNNNDRNDNDNDNGGRSGGCAARSSAAASVSGRSDVASAAAAAAREQRELESSGLLPERVALLLAVAAGAAAGEGGGTNADASSSSSSSSSPSSSAWPAAAKKLLTPPAGSVLAAEVGYLRAQWKELPALDAASAASAAAAAGKGCGCGGGGAS